MRLLNLYEQTLLIVYHKTEHIDLKYLFEILEIFKNNSNEFIFKIVAISKLKLSNPYQKIAVMSYCLEEFNDNNNISTKKSKMIRYLNNKYH